MHYCIGSSTQLQQRFKQILKKHSKDIDSFSFAKEARMIMNKKDDLMYFLLHLVVVFNFYYLEKSNSNFFSFSFK